MPGQCPIGARSALGRPRVALVDRYRLEPVGEVETVVTNYCDWADAPEQWRQRVSSPVVPSAAPGRTLENRQRILEA